MIKKNYIIALLIIIITTFTYVGYAGWKIKEEQKLKKQKQEVIQNRTQDRKKGWPGGVLPGDESYIAPIDTSKIVTDSDGTAVVINLVKITLVEGEDRTIAENIASEVNGKIVGFISPDTYQIELLSVSTLDQLETKLQILRADPRVEIARKSILYDLD